MTESPTILCASDAAYGQHLGVTLYSLLTNYTHAAPVIVYILDSGLLPIDRDRLFRLADSYNAQIHLLPVDPEQLQGLKISHHISTATYMRLLAPQLLPDSVEKILYLDSDIIIQDDITPIWTTDISQYALAAVIEQGNSDYTRLGIPAGKHYFNAGIILMNIRKWREEHIGEQVLRFVRDNPDIIVNWDQDGMNAVLYDQWLSWPLKWNVQSILWSFKPDQANPALNHVEMLQAMKNPSIVHFTGSSKPWQYRNIHPYRQLYFKYLRKTEWRDYKPEGRTPRQIVGKFFRILQNKIRYGR